MEKNSYTCDKFALKMPWLCVCLFVSDHTLSTCCLVCCESASDQKKWFTKHWQLPCQKLARFSSASWQIWKQK